MCGITGAIWTAPQRAIAPDTLQRMTEALHHRGPDDCGDHNETLHAGTVGDVPGIALGFRRLSIIDLPGGHQPMANEDESIWLVFNGEIYNYRELRRRLEGGGHKFRTSSDSETILHLYEELGTECFAQLNGMFAIALWDRNRRQLVLARDRLGQKPLVYHQDGQRLAFASELKSLVEIPDLRREIDPAAIDEYLTYQYVPYPNTIYRGVRKLPPGHFAVWRDGAVRVQRYWDVNFAYQATITQEAAVDRVRELLSDSIRFRLRSDVPVGAFLSGGIDSSLIVALAQKQLEQPIRSFSIGFPVKDFDETQYAAQVAEYVGTRHQRFEVTPDAVGVLQKLVWHYDEPFGDSSAVPTWYLCEQTRQDVKVALSGDGGDELFAGYERYHALALSRKLDRAFPVRTLLGARWIQRLPASPRRRSLMRRAKRFCEAIGQPPPRRYMNWIQIFPESMRADLYTDAMVENLPGDDPFEFLHSGWLAAAGRDDVSRASLADLQTYLPCDLMTKVDIASMAHGLEVRQPMLDYRLVEFAASLPVELKYRRGMGKQLLRDAFAGVIPDNIWTRPKMGFGVPIADWFKNELRPMTHDLLLAGDARSAQWLRPEVVRAMVQQHESGGVNHCYRLWNLLFFEAWLRRWT